MISCIKLYIAILNQESQYIDNIIKKSLKFFNVINLIMIYKFSLIKLSLKKDTLYVVKKSIFLQNRVKFNHVLLYIVILIKNLFFHINQL